MEITVRDALANVPVTIVQLEGELDASNYQDLIACVREAYAAGSRDLLLDLTGLDFLASSGLMALHSAALIMRGDEPPNPENGWGAFRAIGRDRDNGIEEHCRIYNPQPSVKRTLEITGFESFIEVHSDFGTALASFQMA